jgi:hypothetical protein
VTRGKESAAEKRAARQFGEFARSVRRNLRQVNRIRRILGRAEEAVHLCYEKAGAAMLEAKASSAGTEQAFAAWLASFGLSQNELLQCLELGQLALDRRKVGAAAREESFKRIVKESRDQISPEAIRREAEQSIENEHWARR